jgi:hypothetical protein
VRRAPFTLLAFVVASAFAKSPAPEVIFISPCECEGFHGKNRWIAKTDLTPVPLDKSAIQSVTPSQIYAWEGLGADEELTRYSEARMPSKEKWYAWHWDRTNYWIRGYSGRLHRKRNWERGTLVV